MAFSFDDVMEQSGIEDIDYISKQLLADNNVTFCILAVDDVDVVNSQFEADRQWRLTILLELTSGDTRKYYVSFPFNPKRRDKIVVACQDKLKELTASNLPAIVHSLHIVAKPQSKFDVPYYKLEGIRINGAFGCSCVIDNEDKSTGK